MRAGTRADEVEQVLAYVRISEDRADEAAGVGRQREDCVALCDRLGLGAPEVFTDNDTSAYLAKKRPGYEALLAKVRLAPSRLIVWHVDRLYRRPRELEDLIDMVESNPVTIEAVMGGGFDLNTHEGRLMARQLVAIASYESGHKADRIRRANRQKAERGDWHGAPRFGYGINGVLIPGEAAVIREMADRCLAGQSLRSITQWLNDSSGLQPSRSSRTTLGVWHATTVKSILTSARISGQRAYEPASHNGESPSGRKILGPGNWEAIITPEETARLRSIVGAPDRRVSASSLRLLSTIATCGICGSGLMSGSTRSTSKTLMRRRYVCKKENGRPERGGLSVVAEPLEELVTESMIVRLANTRGLGEADQGEQSEIAIAINAATDTRMRLEELSSDYVRGLLTKGEFGAAREAARAEIASAEAVIARASRSSALKVAPMGDPAALRVAWGSWTIPQRRAILSAVIESLVVMPRRDAGAAFRPERVQLRFKV